MKERKRGDSTLDRMAASPVFTGPQGLRAGWGCLVFLLLLYALHFFLAPLYAAMHVQMRHGAVLTPRVAIAGEAEGLLIVVLATLGMARFEGRPLARYGWSLKAVLPRVSAGAAVGFASLAALMGSLAALHFYRIGSLALHGGAAWKYGSAWAFCFVLVACFEEAMVRGYLLFTLARGIGFWRAAALLAILFVLIHGHNAGESPVGLFSVACVSLLFSLMIWYTGSLWLAIGFHAAWDWGESYFWGTPDSGVLVSGHLLTSQPQGELLWSGGPTGPEGSLLVLPTLAMAAAVLFLTWRKRGPAMPFRRT